MGVCLFCVVFSFGWFFVLGGFLLGCFRAFFSLGGFLVLSLGGGGGRPLRRVVGGQRGRLPILRLNETCPCSHRPTRRGRGARRNAFISHAEAQRESEMPGAPWPNLQEVPRAHGYRGAVYSPEADPSYYKGGCEQALQTGADGVAVLKTRSCMSLEPHDGSWEARLPAHLKVQPNEVSRVVDGGGQVPAGAPHTRVNLKGVGVGLWQQGTDEAGYPQVSDATLRGDPVARLHLRLEDFEKGRVTLATRRRVAILCGRVNQEALEAADGTGRQGDRESLCLITSASRTAKPNLYLRGRVDLRGWRLTAGAATTICCRSPSLSTHCARAGSSPLSLSPSSWT